jgi:TonB-linked SusC/RagA family outer membrane protein
MPFLYAISCPSGMEKRNSSMDVRGVSHGTALRLPAQMRKAMRLLTFFIFAASLAVSAKSSSQHVTLSGKDLPLKKVFAAVEAQTGFVFFYNQHLLANTRPVTVSVENMPLNEFLNKALKDQPLHFRLDGKTITLSRKSPDPAVLLQAVAAGFVPLADTLRTVFGTVLNEAGEPVAAASVLVKGTSKGVVTDARGLFMIKVAAGETLVISFVGYDEQEVTIKRAERLSIRLAPSSSSMKDMVITGIYQRKKESFTGSSTTYTTKELKMIGNQNVLQSLKTLDPAFAIIENNTFGSNPNRMPDVEVRGKSSIIGLTDQYGTNPNQPLFILDGFESTLTVINDISMDRVESITVLKDAAATAIYGSKAANGVIVIETKRPAAGQLKLNYNMNSSFNFADLSDYNLMNAAEKLEFERLSGYFSITEPGVAQYNDRMKEVARGVNTYWANEPLHFTVTHRHTLFAEGGDANLRYGATLSFGDNKGVMKGSSRAATNGNIRLIYRKGRLSFTNSLSIDLVNANRETVPFSQFSRANPYLRKYNALGGIDKVVEDFQYSDANFSTQRAIIYNPLYDLSNNNLDRSRSNGFTNNFEIEWRLTNDLRARGRIGINKLTTRSEIFRSPFNSEFANVDLLQQGTYNETNQQQMNYDGDFTLTYGKLLNGKHMINGVAGFRGSQVSTTSTAFAATGFLDDEFANPAFAFGYPQGSKADYQDAKRRSASFFLNTGYSYDNRYMVDATLRADGSSVFGASRQFTTIWSTGLSWNVHNEDFLRNAGYSWLNMLKLRASIGNPGNQNFDDYISMRIYRYNNENRNPFGASVILNSFPNRGLKWQQTLDRNIGVDLMVFNNRLRINADYFNKLTDPLLVNISVPSSAGTTGVQQNLGAQRTTGFTISSDYAIIRNKALIWKANLTMRQLKARFSNVGNKLDNFNKDNKSKNLNRFYDGGSPSDLWAVPSLGIDPATGWEVFLNKNNQQTFVHNYNDERVVGNSEPDLDGVIGTSVFYKGFSASLNMRYRVGGQIFMQTLYEKVENISVPGSALNQDKRALYDRWKKPGDNAKFKAISRTEKTPMSSRFVEDNNILAGESISVGYETAAAKWLRSIGASSISMRAYMNDIFRISTVVNERGIDYPFARSVSFSLGVRF